MFQTKHIDITVHSESTNRFTMVIREADGFPINLNEWSLSGYVYEPFNEIEPVRVDLTISQLSITVIGNDVASLDFTKRYSYKVIAERIADPTERYVVQHGFFEVLDEYRTAA